MEPTQGDIQDNLIYQAIQEYLRRYFLKRGFGPVTRDEYGREQFMIPETGDQNEFEPGGEENELIKMLTGYAI